MKRISTLCAAAFALASCGGVAPKSAPSVDIATDPDRLEVLYFHGKQRCVTCNAIEKLSAEVVDSLHNDKIRMRVIDISQPANESIADKYEVTWSSLILDRGGKTQNLTEMGFSCAKQRPDQFKARLTESINQMMK